MATKVKASKCSAQNSNISSLGAPTKTDKTKIQKPNTPTHQLKKNEDDMKTIHDMFSTMMSKLEKLDIIEHDIKELKRSLEYTHAEISDLRKENEEIKLNQNTAKEKIASLERENATMCSKIVDLQAGSMRDKLLFFNIPETAEENTTKIIHNLLEKSYR